ncbi:hypothetical protein HZH68_001969 [Vespula germanica]|uniref:Uncharacterized protein n=1 Tax=Vespula germanica TaxID=30212 RepID=A0A834NLE5_VESGE|nr:hypothetical protein HZH68_001969 [Vespula germanica]
MNEARKRETPQPAGGAPATPCYLSIITLQDLDLSLQPARPLEYELVFQSEIRQRPAVFLFLQAASACS